MAAGPFVFYDASAENIGKTINLSTDTIKLALVTAAYTFSAAHDEYADITNELTTANGYTIGGFTLTTKTYVQTAGVAKFNSDAAVWNVTGSNVVARRAIMYSDTSSGKKLIGTFLLNSTPADVTTTPGNALTVGPHATNGWFLNTVNAV